MKIVCTDNFNRESIAEQLVVENIKFIDWAIAMCEGLNAKCSGADHPHYFKVVEDDYKLWRGMEELV